MERTLHNLHIKGTWQKGISLPHTQEFFKLKPGMLAELVRGEYVEFHRIDRNAFFTWDHIFKIGVYLKLRELGVDRRQCSLFTQSMDISPAYDSIILIGHNWELTINTEELSEAVRKLFMGVEVTYGG